MEALIFLAQVEKQEYVTSGDDLPAKSDCWLGPTAGQVGRNHRSPVEFCRRSATSTAAKLHSGDRIRASSIQWKAAMRSVTQMVFPQRAWDEVVELECRGPRLQRKDRRNPRIRPTSTQAGGTWLSPADQAAKARRAAFQFHGRRSATLFAG